MLYYPLGEVIREYRIRQGLTQEELCEGICTTATLSKIENAAQNPGRRISEALLERLGVKNKISSLLLRQTEWKNYKIEQEILNLYQEGKPEQMKERIFVYEKQINEKNVLQMQFLFFSKAMYLERVNDDILSAEEMLTSAILCTIKDFSMQMELKERLFTYTELVILLKLCVCSYERNNVKAAVKMLKQLILYLCRNGQEEMRERLYPQMLQTIAGWYFESGRFQDSAQACEEYLRYSVKAGRILNLQKLFCLAAQVYTELGRKEKAGAYTRYLESLEELQGVVPFGSQEEAFEVR